MINKYFYSAICLVTLLTSACKNETQESAVADNEVVKNYAEEAKPEIQQEPWSQQQLLEPSELVHLLENSEDSLVIFSLGAGGIIPGSKDTGPSGEKESLNNLRQELETLPKDSNILIYCGCCPFDICPNVRPAFALLNEMDFTNHQLLNLRENIKVDWIDKGYPVGN
ncbi:rhodanese-like domain-containing protein [Salinimicrobium sp. MT39]|uniref:Rhodanese-like domain-containing protein n=1 Tax=Salinimicrobium profundisediminis TaxID=2994553 RepID=A0A9X3I2E8_9FLAO|nr:rhodanese-like domain-containing protein [Salinimicrobium profundisediminis]MCX2839554.1 rhodanese-like domain-containing protein [Salinimicrobium profundisediminis]